jgi:3-deoxy-D-manno-octulosonate 8-phosphate phosphatase (KDO 8-P phosphatase)
VTSASRQPRLPDIGLVVLDFDGVMTDNRVWVFGDGQEAVVCNRADGLGIDLLRGRGPEILILSTERHPIVQARAAKLGVTAEQAVRDKATRLVALAAERGIPLERVLYVGNDVNDLEAMKLVGWPIAPADAHPSIIAIARYITKTRGGDGVVREIADVLLAGDPALRQGAE